MQYAMLRESKRERHTADRQPARPLRGRAARWFGAGFYACGREAPPTHVTCGGVGYVRAKILKHDFFAVTCMYECPTAPASQPRRLIGKINRRRRFCLLPLGWLGRLVTHNEVCNLCRCAGIAGVPKIVERTDSHTYFYEYIEGTPLSEKPELPADFFEKLRAVLQQIHTRRVVHFDLHKRGNILLGRDGRAYIIDFQVSTCVPDRLLGSKTLSTALRRRLQAYDVYHLYKHKRRLLPEKLTEAERAISTRVGLLLRAHRLIARPYKVIRRACLRRLYARGILERQHDAEPCTETDPARWTP